jgi:DNA-binding response OmpR family regulator
MDSAALTLTLFSRGWLFFDSRAITWDGTRHAIPTPEINGAQIMDIITFSNSECGPGTDLNDVCATAFKGIQAVAEDTDLRTERNDVRPSLLNLMPEGDVTGISLVSLLGAAELWSVEQTGADSYAISCDEQLAMGIPECEHMLAGVVDALRSADPSLCGEASYTFLHTSGAELPEPVDEVESADGPVVETEPEPEVELEPNSMIEPEVETESDAEPEPIGASAKEPTAIVCDGMRIDLRTRLVHVFDREVQLYRREFDLLVLLARNPESTYSTASIRDALGANCELNSINMYVGLVRSKIGDDPNYPQWVATVEGGYRFVGKNPRLVYEEEAEVLPIEHWRSANDGRLLVIDRVSETAAVDGELSHLSKKEFAILSALTSRQGGVWENEELSQLVLGVGFVESSRALSTYMNKIRSVLGDSPKSTSWIKTVRGVGYRMIGTLEPVDLTAYASGSDNSPIASQETNADHGEALEVSDVAPDTEFDITIDIQPRTVIEVTEEADADGEAPLQDIASQLEPAPSPISESDDKTIKNAERLATKAANEQEAMMNLEFPDFPQELLSVEQDIHTHASRYAVALYVIARVVPEGRPFSLVQLRRIVRPYLLSAGLKRLSIPTLNAACRELAARELGSIELDSDGEITTFCAQRLTAQDALRIAMEFDTLGAFDPALSTAAVETDVAPEPVPEPEAVPAPELEAEPEPVAEPVTAAEPESIAEPAPVRVAEPEPVAEPAPAPEIDPAALSKLEDAIAEATRELAALDPKPLQDKLDALTQERAGLGFFKFSAKKEIDQKITAVERELAELKSRDSERRELKTLLDDYAKQHDDLLNAR